ncbi:hypothetical protein BDR22DRAFT_798531, partial [Usnea florida]
QNLINSPENVNEGRWWVLVTSSIAHASPVHLLINTFAVWGFVQGTITLFGVPLFVGAWLFTAASSSAPRFGGSVGASGAICGLTGLFLCYMPKLPIRLLFVLPMPLWLGELAFTVGSGYCMATGYAPSVGHAAHLGGTAAGIAYYFALVRPWLRRVGRI